MNPSRALGPVFSLLCVLALITACVAPQVPATVASPTNAPAQSTAATKATPTPAAAKKFVIGTVALPKSLDPCFESSGNVFPMYEAIFDTLVEADDNGKPIPKLAESWKSLDPTTWEFKLKKGVKFHNGEPFDADAVKFSVERIANPDVKSNWLGRNAFVKEVKIIDPYTVHIITSEPAAMLFSGLMVDYILPPKYFKEVGADLFGDKGVGTGPFKVVNWKKNEIMEVVRNPDYWGGVPKIETVVFRQIPEPATLQAAFETGEVDMAYPITPDSVNYLRGKGHRVEVKPLAFALTVNLRPKGPDVGPLSDVRVRQAICYAVDQKKIFDTVLLGMGEFLDGQIVGKGTTGWNPDIHAYPYDPQKAKQLLAEAGYPNGFETTIETPVGRYMKDKELMEAISAYLAQVGIKAPVKTLESAAFVDRSLAGSIGPIFPTSWQSMPALDAHIPFGIFLDSATRNCGNSKEYDALWAKAGATTDFEEHKRLLMPVAQYLHDQAWGMYFTNIPWIAGISGKVQNIELRLNYRFDWLKVDIK